MSVFSLMLRTQCTCRVKKKREYGTNHASSRAKNFHHFTPQDMRTAFSVSRGEDLCGWEISQLLLLHDDLGIVEWFNDEERSMFPVTNRTGWCHSYFDCVTPRSAVNVLETTQKDVSALNAFSCRLHEVDVRPFTPNNRQILPAMMPRNPAKQDEEIEEVQHSSSSKPSHKVKADNKCDPWRCPEKRDHLLDTGPVLSPISKICTLEKRLAAQRRSKIEKCVEGLCQPLETKARRGLSKRELFNPSVISVIAGDIDTKIPRKDSLETRKTLYKTYLQLLPIDGVLKLRRRANTVNLPPPKKCLTRLPAIEAQSVFFVPKLSCNQGQLGKADVKSFRPQNDP